MIGRMNTSHLRGCPASPRTTATRLVLLGLLVSCGGGGDGGGNAIGDPPAAAPALPGVTVSAASPVAPGCNGGRDTGSVFVNAEVEPIVAASPVTSDLLVGAWQQDRASDGGARALVSAVSADGGRSWTRTLQPMSRCGGAAPGSTGDFERATDPWVDIGADGTVHLMGLAFSGRSLAAGSSSAMLVTRSSDGGRTWSAPRVLQRDGETHFNDKNTLTVDPLDARFVYAVWNRLDQAGNGPTLMARSTDGGIGWEAAREIYVPAVGAGVSQTVGNRIVVLTEGPERGLLVNLFTQIDTVAGQSSATLRAMRSADRGVTWSAPVTIAEHRGIGTRDPDTGAAIRDGAIVPSIAAGPGGVLWVAWQDARYSGGVRDAIALSRSNDGARSWSAPVAVNRDPAVAAFTPVLAVHPDGRIALMHFDLRSNTADPGTLLADLWLLSSRDGAVWAETALARRVDIAIAPATGNGAFLGDYQGLAASGRVLVPLVALPGPDTANRSEVVALRVDLPPAAATARKHIARAGTPAPGMVDETGFARARSAAIRRAMEARLPGWGGRVGQRP